MSDMAKEERSPDEQAGCAALLEANGYTQEDLGNASSPILELEMFLQEYPKMIGLNNFTLLKTLKLIDQCIERIEGLSSCPQLEKLWLMENRIAKIEGLEACTGLSELYLYSNRISTITGLDHLTGLQVLWLADNYISSLAGLSKLQQLRQLNLARNDIRLIGTSLLANSALTSLNLADNKISSFQDVAGLAKLTGLQELCLADPFWGECPVAGLCNYQTFVLYLLPQLPNLDTLVLAEETKAAACATFTKKQLYYNMRIRTLRRAAADLARQAKVGCQVYASRWTQLHSLLACAAKGLQRQLHQASGSEHQTLQEQLTGMQSAMQSVLGRQELLASRLAADTQAAAAVLEGTVSRLQLELSSGGNIRLEEARPDDSWLASCQELLRSRLIQAGEPGAGNGITDIQVLSAARVHNRHVRLQFEKLLASGNSESADNKQCTDYLFYGEHPALPGEMMGVAQHGFRPCSEYSALGLDGAVRLANCVNLADQLRIQHALEGAAASKGRGSGSCSSDGGSSSMKAAGGTPCVLEGQLLVCKVYLGAVQQEVEGHVQLLAKPGGKKLHGKDGQLQASASLDGARVDAQQYPGVNAVYRTAVVAAEPADAHGSANGSSSKQKPTQVLPQHRMWYLFDNAAVLPEYLVTFRYTVEPGSALAAFSSSDGAPAMLANQAGCAESSKIQQPDPLLRLCARPLQTWLSARQQQQAQPGTQTPVQHADASRLPANIKLEPAPEELEQHCRSLLAAAGAATAKMHLAVVSPAALSSFVGGKELSTLAELSLHDCGLSSCDGLLIHLPCLRTLVLSFNKLTGLDGLMPAATTNSSSCQLASLDVSHNQISTWKASWMAQCPKLTLLDASHNQLVDIKQLEQLTRSVQQLLQLDLTHNPLQQHKAYHLHLASALPQLQQLDGKPVACPGLSERAVVPAMMKAGATQWHSETGPTATLQATGAADWRLLLHSLVLEGRGLTSLAGLTVANRLVCASFADNLLTELSGLQGCSQLRELNLSNNLITELSPLSSLSSLRQLDVSFNSVSDLLPLAPLTGLSQLSVEGNQLSSLAGLAAMACLLELYAASNAITDIKEAERLAVLPRLVILDLVGNPVAAAGGSGAASGAAAHEEYRQLLLYRLRHLKVLDGVPAEAAELAAARAKYSGRLTMSFLEEQLGSSCCLSAIRSLDVSGLRIKDMGAVFGPGSPFSSLAELVLDNNTISSLAPLAGLTALSLLKMNNNRLGEAEQGSIRFAAPAAAAGVFAASTGASVGAAAGGVGSRGATVGLAAEQPQAQPLLPNLQVLHMAGNGLTSLKHLQLQYLPALRSLFVQGNELQRLDGLEGLLQLRELVADKNKIRALEPSSLAPLVRLRELRLEDNLIKSLSLAGPAGTGAAAAAAATGDTSTLGGCLPSLCVLHLGSNRLVDMADLDRLGGLPSLLEVSLAGNPFARKQVYRPLLISRCPRLQVIDQQQVTEEERSYAEAMFTMPPPEPSPADVAAGLLASAADSRGACWGGPLAVAAAGGLGGSPSRVAAAAGPGKLSALAMPAVLDYDALMQAAANSAGLQVAGTSGGLLLPGVVSSVPSIQSGVLVLSGAAAFGLEGMAIGAGSSGRSGSPGGSSWANRQRPQSGKRGSGAGSPAGGSKQQLPNGAAAAGSVQMFGSSQGNAVRRVMGPSSNAAAGGSSGGFPVRQVAYRGY